MHRKVFGSLAAGAMAMALSGTAMAGDKSEKKDAKGKKAKTESGWCKSNECGGHVAGSKNSCAGEMACKGITKEVCEKDGKGTWTTDPKPKK